MIKYSNSGIPILNLEDLPKDKFKISVEKEVIGKLVDKLKIKGKQLYSEFSRVESQKNKKIISIKKSFLLSWKKGERIPLDCFILLCDLTNNKLKYLQKNVKRLDSGYSKGGWKIKFPIMLNKDFFTISEAIRVEGCIIKGRNSVQGIAFNNKDIEFVKLIEEKLKKLNIESKSLSKLLHVYCYLDTNQKVTKVSCCKTNKELHFSVKNQRLIFLDPLTTFDKCKKRYNVEVNGKNFFLEINVDEYNVVYTKSKLHSTAFFSLQAYNTVFAQFLHHTFKIPHSIKTKKSFIIDFPFNMEKLSRNMLKEIINVVVSSEGHVGQYEGYRIIVIKIGSPFYLQKIKKILSILDIESVFRKSTTENLYILTIKRKNNLINFDKQIKLYTKIKRNKLKEMIKSYDKYRIAHFSATKTYLLALQEIEPTTLKEVSFKMNKKYTSVMTQFNRLYNKGLIKKRDKKYTGKGNTPWIFELTEKGKEFLSKE